MTNHKTMLRPNFNNQSSTSITSEAATFHSAQASPALEMERNTTAVPAGKPQPELSTIMSRTDSGYEPGHERRSTSTSSRSSRRPRHSTSSTSARPTTKRASRSSQSSSVKRTSPRPAIHSRYTTPRGRGDQVEPQTQYQFFQFPSLSPPTPQTPSSEIPPQPAPLSHPPLPPATIHYFLLPETRRLEYAAIDAASRGVRGFVTRLVPNCILPPEYRRAKFHDESRDSDAGSVRRYRLSFPDPEEKGVVTEGSRSNNSGSATAAGQTQPGLWRRMMSFGKR